MIIPIDGLLIQNRDELFKTFREYLDFPDYFGNNLDALYDIITESYPDLKIEFHHYNELQEVLGNRYMMQFKRMLIDAGVVYHKVRD